MFVDLRKGFQVHTLDTNGVPKYEMGRVVNHSDPYYMKPQPGSTYPPIQTRVVDLTIELESGTQTYTVPEQQNVAKNHGITISTTAEFIANELNAIRSESEAVIDSVPLNKDKIESCNKILEDINPAFKQSREQDRRIADIETKVDKIADSFDEFKSFIINNFKNK